MPHLRVWLPVCSLLVLTAEPALAQTPAPAPAPVTPAPAPAPETPITPAPAPVAADPTLPDPAAPPAPADPAPGPEPAPTPLPVAPEPTPAPTPPSEQTAASPVQADPAHAGGPPPRHRIVYATTLVARFNPLGVELRPYFMYHRRLTTRTGRLFEDTHFGLGLTPALAPSIARLGATAELVPLAILHLRASYYLITYFGHDEFKAHDFRSPYDDFSHEVIKARSEAKQGLSTYGGQAELSALLQAKVGPIAMRNEVLFYHNNIKLRGDNDVFYDLRHDILAPARGWFVGNDTDILYVNEKIRLTAGVRGTYFHMFYPDSVYEPGDEKIDNRNDHARVGPVLAYSFKDRPKRRFLKPTLFLVVQWWVKHRYRAGQEINQGLPLMVLGFSFNGELWRKP